MSDIPDPMPNLSLACETVLTVGMAASEVADIAKGIQAGLAKPSNYPSVAEAIVPGDHVVLAIDPSVPQIRQVIAGIMLALAETEVGQIDAVLWDEATDDQLEMVGEEMGPSSRVVRHQGDLRRDVRYLAADEGADPIYVNRLLVDADFVLPIASGRFGFDLGQHDSTGIYPMLVDSSSRKRYANANALDVPASQTAWLLGVQMMVCVVPGLEDQVQAIMVGSIGWIDEQLAARNRTELPPAGQADLVVAVVESGTVPTWQNAVRAIQAAAAIALEDATIVLWSGITDSIPQMSQDMLENDAEVVLDASSADADDEDFPAWNADLAIARQLAEIASGHRLLIHSKLDSEAVELAGYGAIDNADQLTRLSAGFGVGCVLRRASCLAPAASEMTANQRFSTSDQPES